MEEPSSMLEATKTKKGNYERRTTSNSDRSGVY
uniref:Uncharacterized protein n=1 Tax=Siphoviridae sp. ctrAf3 TaxID=2825687 RepID=A0A8S5PVM0_9CAUD|nr:MAG TPA: hypothetical protein [Siphoviridae sp. ctrAf3]